MIPINEIYGPTIQGEGLDVGIPSIFLRLHHCPVKCPGCDTGYTWNGKEAAQPWNAAAVFQKIEELGASVLLSAGKYPAVIVTGGEPLLQIKNAEFSLMLNVLVRGGFNHIAIETSGFCGKAGAGGPTQEDVVSFLDTHFHAVSLSPKITPCLHGMWSYDDLTYHCSAILEWMRPGTDCVKLVVRDQADVDAAISFRKKFMGASDVRCYLMPYGITTDEILKCARDVVAPAAIKYGFCVTPRLHSILWGYRRGI